MVSLLSRVLRESWMPATSISQSVPTHMAAHRWYRGGFTGVEIGVQMGPTPREQMGPSSLVIGAVDTQVRPVLWEDASRATSF